jgi:uridine kinase
MSSTPLTEDQSPLKLLILVRGLPGSGKSTLANQILANKRKLNPKLSSIHLEADQYLTDDKGNYHWTFDKFKNAHNWCFTKSREAMEKGIELVVISNCFIHKSSMTRYQSAASVMGYDVDVIVCGGKYEGVHPIPPHIYESMRKHWED